MIAVMVMALLVVAGGALWWWRPRVVDVRHWDRNGTAVTTVTTRRGRRLYATTTFHRYDRSTQKYLPFHLVDQRVDHFGQWRR